MNTKYIVINEHTLGYLSRKYDIPGDWYPVGILRASILKGSGLSEMSGTVVQFPSNNVRPATLADFEDYRLSVPPDFTKAEL